VSEPPKLRMFHRLEAQSLLAPLLAIAQLRVLLADSRMVHDGTPQAATLAKLARHTAGSARAGIVARALGLGSAVLGTYGDGRLEDLLPVLSPTQVLDLVPLLRSRATNLLPMALDRLVACGRNDLSRDLIRATNDAHLTFVLTVRLARLAPERRAGPRSSTSSTGLIPPQHPQRCGRSTTPCRRRSGRT
jgi:hypothetical protein